MRYEGWGTAHLSVRCEGVCSHIHGSWGRMCSFFETHAHALGAWAMMLHIQCPRTVLPCLWDMYCWVVLLRSHGDMVLVRYISLTARAPIGSDR